MQASKALVIVIVVGAIAAFGVFFFMPGLRPGFVAKWFDTAEGVTPAKTPREALEKFHERIQVRDYKRASRYIGGPLAEEFKINGDAAKKLGDAVDNVLSAMETKNLNSPQCKTILTLLQPFPKDMKIKDVKWKEGEETATAVVEFDLAGVSPTQFRTTLLPGDPMIYLALLPLLDDRGQPWFGAVPLKLEGDGKEKGWRIQFPVGEVLQRASVMKRDHGNYVSALEGFSRSIKNDSATVANLEGELKKVLNESKPK